MRTGILAALVFAVLAAVMFLLIQESPPADFTAPLSVESAADVSAEGEEEEEEGDRGGGPDRIGKPGSPPGNR